MGANRVFMSQETLDAWVEEKRVTLEGDMIKLNPGGPRLVLTTAVRFVNEVGGGGDAAKLVGKVKTMEQLASIGGEYCSNSVLLGDDAYDVVEGFLAEPVPGARPAQGAPGDPDPVTAFLLRNR